MQVPTGLFMLCGAQTLANYKLSVARLHDRCRFQDIRYILCGSSSRVPLCRCRRGNQETSKQPGSTGVDEVISQSRFFASNRKRGQPRKQNCFEISCARQSEPRKPHAESKCESQATNSTKTRSVHVASGAVAIRRMRCPRSQNPCQNGCGFDFRTRGS